MVLTIVSGFDHCGTQILDGLEEALGLLDVLGLEDGRCPGGHRYSCFALLAWSLRRVRDWEHGI